MSLWDKPDKIERQYLKLIIRKFRLLQRRVLVLDELNILNGVAITYQEVDALCKKGFSLIDEGDEMFDLWLLDQLNNYDPVTKYRWGTEFERKKQRLYEALMTDMLNKKPKAVINKDIDVAMRYIERQFKQTFDDLFAAYTIKQYTDDGVEQVKWITAGDEKVCETCAPRDGKVYSIKELPQWPAHYNCRCEVVPLG